MVATILNAFNIACIEISSILRNTHSTHLSSMSSNSNVSGDIVKNLDIISNDIILKILKTIPEVRGIGSEEESHIQWVNETGKYLVCYDPLDGSSNIEFNITVGTIFAIYEIPSDGVIRDGHSIVMAGYCLYGSSTQMVVATSNCVKMYQLLEDSFNLIDDNIRIPISGVIYSINESYRLIFTDPKINRAIDKFLNRNMTARWVGSLVADAHRTLLKGGFFSYPGNTMFSQGKLRLLYEVYPMAYIFEASGGNTTDDGTHKSLLDIPFPDKDPHQKIPTVLSSTLHFTEYISGYDVQCSVCHRVDNVQYFDHSSDIRKPSYCCRGMCPPQL